MRVHHLNCVSACPLGGFMLDALTRGSLRGRLATHCLLLELPRFLMLVDTGYGLNDVAAPRSRLDPFMRALMKPELRQEATAIRQIQALGFDPRDVRHIALSHLDFDHAGGLDDFPEATVHLLSAETNAALAQKTLLDRMRYRPAQWSTREKWRSYPSSQGERWFDFDAVRGLDGIEEDVLLVPLAGHTLGHAGVAIWQKPGWLLYAGDAYFFHREMDVKHPWCTPGLRLYQSMMEKDRAQRLLNQSRLRALKATEGAAVSIFCAHDVREFEVLAATRLLQPALPASFQSHSAGAASVARAASWAPESRSW